ncbi:MAG: BAX inhibitor (BI)-1/YccA family protein, partial [Bacteroidetes bacterium]|nr:BAX inhibitor (BI)-1/YccA family protein [Bacteroidota bacterium]
MEINKFNYVQSPDESAVMSRTFMSSVFSWMFAALAITSVIAYYFGNSVELLSLLINPELGKLSTLGYV